MPDECVPNADLLATTKNPSEDQIRQILALFESAAGSNDPELAQFAKKTLPTLKEHKALAQKLPGQ